MFDKYLIDETSVRNTGAPERSDGFAFEARLGYYRGLGLSMIEELAVSVDGQQVPREAVRFDEGKGALSLDEMAGAFDRRWGFGQLATILVDYPGGLARGEHELSLQQKLRVSYLPFPSFNTDNKRVRVR